MSLFNEVDDNITDAGDLVSSEVFSVLADNVNYLIDSMPVGSIICILDGFPGVPTPDPTIWRECDGSEITEGTSPIRDQPAPNYADEGRYMRAYTNAGSIGNFGGANEKNLSHSHGGFTDNYVPPNISESDNEYPSPTTHRHSMPTDLNTPINFEPPHFRVKHYVKIR
jgi:hypothetical protein